MAARARPGVGMQGTARHRSGAAHRLARQIGSVFKVNAAWAGS